LIKIIFWLQAFAAPIIVFGVIAFLIYNKTTNASIAILIFSVGIVTGIILAEFIRRKYGLENFFAVIHGSDGSDEKVEKKSR
jgi:uncharacterized membrane protein